jgi:cell division control protein 6
VPLNRSVFKDETKLDINYIPNRLPHREAELRLLNEFFNFAIQSPQKMSQRVMITGDVGTGKTALSQRFGANITSEALKNGINLRYIHINCREANGSLFLILQQAISVFHPHFPKRGFSAEEMLNSFVQALDDENFHVILALDEFESLVKKEGSEAVYKLTRLQETRQNKAQRLSLITILRYPSTIDNLDASTRSTLQSNIVRLERYSKQQLFDILTERTSVAFNPMSVPEDTLNLIAQVAMSENGNARFGIELLWRAGKYADSADIGRVPPECVRKAVASIIPTMQKSELNMLNLHEKLFLLGISRTLKKNEKAYVTLNEAEQSYNVVCEELGTQPKSHTQLWKYLQKLSALEIVKTQVSTSGSRGRFTTIYLPRIPADELERELQALTAKSE